MHKSDADNVLALTLTFEQCTSLDFNMRLAIFASGIACLVTRIDQLF